MNIHTCLRCGQWWATDIPRHRITGQVCPACIPAAYPATLHLQPPPKTTP